MLLRVVGLLCTTRTWIVPTVWAVLAFHSGVVTDYGGSIAHDGSRSKGVAWYTVRMQWRGQTIVLGLGASVIAITIFLISPSSSNASFSDTASSRSRPPRVKQVEATTIDSVSAVVQWKKVSVATRYHLRLLQQSDSGWDQIRVVTNIKKRSATVANLDPDTSYGVQVRAVRKQRRGQWSKRVTFQTDVTEDDGGKEDEDDSEEDKDGGE